MSESVDLRGPVATFYDRSAYIEKSPFVKGFVAGIKATLVGAPLGAGFQMLQNKDILPGAIVGAGIAAVAAGTAAAAKQKLSNLSDESVIRYHAEQIKEREPKFFMPPKSYLGGMFLRHGGRNVRREN